MPKDNDPSNGFDDFEALSMGDSVTRSLNPDLSEEEIARRALIIASHAMELKANWNPEIHSFKIEPDETE